MGKRIGHSTLDRLSMIADRNPQYRRVEYAWIGKSKRPQIHAWTWDGKLVRLSYTAHPTA